MEAFKQGYRILDTRTYENHIGGRDREMLLATPFMDGSRPVYVYAVMPNNEADYEAMQSGLNTFEVYTAPDMDVLNDLSCQKYCPQGCKNHSENIYERQPISPEQESEAKNMFVPAWKAFRDEWGDKSFEEAKGLEDMAEYYHEEYMAERRGTAADYLQSFMEKHEPYEYMDSVEGDTPEERRLNAIREIEQGWAEGQGHQQIARLREMAEDNPDLQGEVLQLEALIGEFDRDCGCEDPVDTERERDVRKLNVALYGEDAVVHSIEHDANALRSETISDLEHGEGYKYIERLKELNLSEEDMQVHTQAIGTWDRHHGMTPQEFAEYEQGWDEFKAHVEETEREKEIIQQQFGGDVDRYMREYVDASPSPSDFANVKVSGEVSRFMQEPDEVPFEQGDPLYDQMGLK